MAITTARGVLSGIDRKLDPRWPLTPRMSPKRKRLHGHLILYVPAASVSPRYKGDARPCSAAFAGLVRQVTLQDRIQPLVPFIDGILIDLARLGSLPARRRMTKKAKCMSDFSSARSYATV